MDLLNTARSLSAISIQMPYKFLFVGLLYFLSLGLSAQHSKKMDKNEQAKLYFDMGELGGWVPFRTGAATGRAGVLIELSQAMEDYSGIQFIPVNFPAKRAEKALKDGLVDFDFVCLEWLKNGVAGEEYFTTEPFFEITEHFITLNKNKDLFANKESIFGKHVGTIAGYFYFDDYKFIRTDFLNENQLMLGLKHDRFKVIIMERETAKYWAKLNNTEIGFAALHSSGHLLMRIRKENKALLPLLNQTIKALKSSGKLKAILESHGVESIID
jgi:ABC-type amino acid transport substrate-binding protein